MSEKKTYTIARHQKDGSTRYITVHKRRSIRDDRKYFDPPRIIWQKVKFNRCSYKTHESEFQLRDLAFCCLLYLSSARVSEICRFRFERKDMFKTLPSVRGEQFVQVGDFLELRSLRVLKRKFILVKVGEEKKWVKIEHPSQYPNREPIRLPLKGELSKFTEPIQSYVETLTPQKELFMFRSARGYQIVNTCTGGEFPHYLRAMGLRMWLRMFSKDLSELQRFSSHTRIENLMEYLREIKDEEISARILSVKFEDFEPKMVQGVQLE